MDIREFMVLRGNPKEVVDKYTDAELEPIARRAVKAFRRFLLDYGATPELVDRSTDEQIMSAFATWSGSIDTDKKVKKAKCTCRDCKYFCGETSVCVIHGKLLTDLGFCYFGEMEAHCEDIL